MTDTPRDKKDNDARKEILGIDLPPKYVVPNKKLPTKTDSENNNVSITSTKKERETRDYTPKDRVHPGEPFHGSKSRFDPTFDIFTKQPLKPITTNQEISHSPEPANDTDSMPANQTETVMSNFTPKDRVHPGGLFDVRKPRYDPTFDTFTQQPSIQITNQEISHSVEQKNDNHSMSVTQSTTMILDYTEKSPEYSGKPFNDITSTLPAPNTDKLIKQIPEPNDSEAISKKTDANSSIADQQTLLRKKLSNNLDKLNKELLNSRLSEMGNSKLNGFIEEEISKQIKPISDKMLSTLKNQDNPLTSEQRRNQLIEILKDLSNVEEKINSLTKDFEAEMSKEKYNFVPSEHKEKLIETIRPRYEKAHETLIKIIEKLIGKDTTSNTKEPHGGKLT